jgi:hypothetical protein
MLVGIPFIGFNMRLRENFKNSTLIVTFLRKCRCFFEYGLSLLQHLAVMGLYLMVLSFHFLKLVL